MSTRKYTMPRTRPPWQENQGGIERLKGWANYFRGIEDTSSRVAAYVDPSTATAQQIAQAMIDAGSMKDSG